MTSLCLALVKKTLNGLEFQYSGLFGVKPTLMGHTNIALASPIGFFRGNLRIERFSFTSNLAPIGVDSGLVIFLFFINKLASTKG